MDEIEQKLQEAQNDNKRAQAGMVFGRSEDYQYAHPTSGFNQPPQ
jgi:hypothetical protein